MKKLYEYIIESISKRMKYDEIVNIPEIYDRAFDEKLPERIPDNPLFIIKKSSPDQICIRNIFKTEACEILCSIFGVTMADFDTDEHNNCTIQPKTGDYGPVRIHITSKTIGPKIETRDQETATCVVFNTVVDTYDDEKYTKGLDKAPILGLLLDKIQVQFDNTGWYETFALQVDKIINVLGGIENAKNYRMERFGGHDKYKPEDWNLWERYSKMVCEYTKFMGGRKDNWDPTDVILYRKDQEEHISSLFTTLYNRIKALQPGDEIDFVAEELRKLYKDPSRPFMGISLKKLGKTTSFETYNMTEGDRVQIKEVGEVRYGPGGRSAYVELQGNYKFEDMISDDDIHDFKPHKIKLMMRSFGAGINAIDVTLESGPSLGKCPVAIWTKILGVKSTASIEDCVNAFTRFMEKPDIRDINIIVQSATKNGPHCLPFVLIH